MTSVEFIKMFKSAFPEFVWNEDMFSVKGSYFVNTFDFNKYRHTMYVECFPELLYNNLIKVIGKYPTVNRRDIDAIAESDYNVSIVIKDITEDEAHCLIDGVRGWVNDCNRLMKSDKPKDQIVFIHDDCRKLTYFIDSFKFIIQPDNPKISNVYFGVGIMNATDWDLSNDELIQECADSTGDSFAIYDEDDFDNKEIKELLYKLYREHPYTRKIKDIYFTDFD